MKRIVTGILTVVLLCTLCIPALAEEMKYIHEWTEEEWTSALEEWTEEDCKAYAIWLFGFLYEEEEDWEAIYDIYEKMEAAMEEWDEEQLEFYWSLEDLYYAYSRQLRVDNEKREAGFVYLDGINVHINGKFLTFSGPRAVVTGGATMIPADAVAAALDAEYASEGDTGTLTLRGESVSFTVGQEVSVSAGFTLDYETYERVEVFTTATPYLEEGVLMVPLRAVTSAFDCTLLWLPNYQVAVVLDRQAIVDKINEDFTIVNDFVRSLADGALAADQPTETTIRTTLEGMLYGESRHTAALLSADMTLVQNGEDLQAEVTVDTDSKNLKSLLDLVLGSDYSYFEDLPGEIVKALDTYVNGSHSMIIKGKDIYVKSPVQGLTAPLAEGKWVRTTVEEEDESASLSGSGLMSLLLGTDGLTVGDYIFDDQYFYSYYFYNYYDTMMSQAKLYAMFAGDKSFTVKNDVYTLKGNADSVFSSCVAAGLYTRDQKQAFTYSFGSKFSYQLSFTREEDRLSSYTLDFSAKPRSSVPGTLTISADYSLESSHLSISYVGDILGKIVLTLDSETVPTTKKIKAPPAGEVIDADELIGTADYPEDEDWDYFGWVDDPVPGTESDK